MAPIAESTFFGAGSYIWIHWNVNIRSTSLIRITLAVVQPVWPICVSVSQPVSLRVLWMRFVNTIITKISIRGLNSSLSTYICVPHALVNWNTKRTHVSMFLCTVQYWTKSRPTNKCVKIFILTTLHRIFNIQLNNKTEQQRSTNNRQQKRQRWSVKNLNCSHTKSYFKS